MGTNNYPNLFARASQDNAATTITLTGVSGRRIEGLKLNVGFTATPTAPKVGSLYSLNTNSTQTLLAEFVITQAGTQTFNIEGYMSLQGESLVFAIPASGTDGNLCKSSVTGKLLY
jgi:hypothetical protein